MPNWSRLARQVNRVIQKRGGPESVKEDAEELAGIAREKRPMSEKLKEAAQAIKQPGAGPGDPGEEQDPGPQQVPGEQHAPGPPPAPGREPDPSPRGGGGPREGQQGA